MFDLNIRGIDRIFLVKTLKFTYIRNMENYTIN